MPNIIYGSTLIGKSTITITEIGIAKAELKSAIGYKNIHYMPTSDRQ